MNRIMSSLQDTMLRAHLACAELRRRCRLGGVSGQRGAATVEYALLIAVIVTMVIAAATYMFDPLKEFFLSIVEKIQGIADDTTAKSKF